MSYYVLLGSKRHAGCTYSCNPYLWRWAKDLAREHGWKSDEEQLTWVGGDWVSEMCDPDACGLADVLDRATGSSGPVIHPLQITPAHAEYGGCKQLLNDTLAAHRSACNDLQALVAFCRKGAFYVR